MVADVPSAAVSGERLRIFHSNYQERSGTENNKKKFKGVSEMEVSSKMFVCILYCLLLTFARKPFPRGLHRDDLFVPNCSRRALFSLCHLIFL